LIAIRFLIRAFALEVTRIIPPFRLKFRMGEMVLRERESPSGKRPLEVFGEKMGRKY
jgi:hypothetical protein